MVNITEFAKRLEKILDYYGLSASAFADKIEFNRSSISHLLSGRNKPSLDFVLKVLKTFPEVELHWLLNGKGTFPKDDNQPQQNIPENSPTQKTETNTLLKDEEPKKTQLSHSHTSISNGDIERIVFFYKDGTFKEYKNLP